MHNDLKSVGKELLNRVPEITIYFWLIKILGTTVGETAADFLNVNLNLGLTITSVVVGLLLLIALFFQFKEQKYVPSVYWSVVVLISVFGTLVTDNLTDSLGIPLEISTIFFSVGLAIIFALWYAKEKTLSMHSIVTARREAYYWLAILFTFALGTASGDLMAEGLGLGYLNTGIIVAVVISIIAIGWKRGLNPVLSFWLIYILTRPLGASLGDFLSQPQKYGGLGLGASVTSFVFIAAIIGTVVYLTYSRKDLITESEIEPHIKQKAKNKKAQQQAMITLGLIILISGAGYLWRQSSLHEQPIAPLVKTSDIPSLHQTTSSMEAKSVTSTDSALGDTSSFQTITHDTLNLVQKGDMSAAKTRIADLEHEWDAAEATLKPMNKERWTEVDDAIDTVLRQLRAVHPDQAKSAASLETLLLTLK